MRRVTPFDARAYYYYYPAEVRGCKSPAVIGSGGFSPLSLSPHLWLDPSDLTTLRQERTGASATTPSVVDGVVGTMLDKSGNGHHVVAPSDAARPILRSSGAMYWLELDGSDDTLAVSYALAQPWDRISAWRILTKTNGRRLLGASGGVGQIFTEGGAAEDLHMFSGAELTIATTPNQDVDFILTERHSGANSRGAIDAGSYVTGNAGASDATGFIITGADPINSRFYGAVKVARALMDAETTQLRTYLAAKQGRVL